MLSQHEKILIRCNHVSINQLWLNIMSLVSELAKMFSVSDKTGSNLGLFRPRERLANTYKMVPDETPLASVTGLPHLIFARKSYAVTSVSFLLYVAKPNKRYWIKYKIFARRNFQRVGEIQVPYNVLLNKSWDSQFEHMNFSAYEMKERLINLLNMIRKQLKSEPKMSRFKFVVNGFICEDTGQDVKLWFY